VTIKSQATVLKRVEALDKGNGSAGLLSHGIEPQVFYYPEEHGVEYLNRRIGMRVEICGNNLHEQAAHEQLRS